MERAIIVALALALADVIAEAGDGVFVGVVVFDFDDAGDDLVEEVAVVRDENQAALVLDKPLFQPGNSGQVENHSLDLTKGSFT